MEFTKVKQYLLAAASGAMLALAFPKLDVAGLAWIAPAGILASGFGGTRSFRCGYVAGLVHYLISLYWLLFIPFPSGAVLGWLALSVYLAFYPAIWNYLCWKALPGGKVPETWRGRALWTIFGATLWVSLELVITYLFTGFPWNLLGVTQWRLTPLLQIASFTGVYGVAFLVVWFSAALFCGFVLMLRDRTPRARVIAEVALPVSAAILAFAWGYQRMSLPDNPRGQIKVAMVQPSIPQEVIFDPEEGPGRFKKLMDLSMEAMKDKPDVLIWPEASVPSLSQANYQAIIDFIRTNQIWMIFGADDASIEDNPKGGFVTNYYNSCFLFSPEGKYLERYQKQQLVIFGEYVPLSDFLPFLAKLTPIEGGFTPGKGPVPFRIASPRAKIGMLICFEDVFARLARKHVDDDTEFLLNLTNNGWFGESAAQWQHALAGMFRAIENGLPLLRCTNNGLTCWFDRYGRLKEYFGQQTRNVYAPGVFHATIPLEPPTPTFYRTYGDVFALSCIAVSALIFLLFRRKQN